MSKTKEELVKWKTVETRTPGFPDGVIFIKEEARKNVLENCGMTIGGGIHSTMLDEEIDWDFPCHPEKKIVSINIKRAPTSG